jgi:hypothetical protein
VHIKRTHVSLLRGRREEWKNGRVEGWKSGRAGMTSVSRFFVCAISRVRFSDEEAVVPSARSTLPIFLLKSESIAS